MNQWVAAICQASVQYIPISHSPLPGVIMDKSVSSRVQDVSAPVYNEGEIYDDAGSVNNFNEKAELQLSDEQHYDDVSTVPQGNGRLESKPDCGIASDEKCPPIPPRRLPPAVPQDGLSDEESVFDDTGASKKHSQYSNMVDVDAVGRKRTEIRTSTILNWRHKIVQPRTGTKEGHTTLQPSTDKEGAHTKVQAGTNSVHTTAQPQQSAKHKMQYNAEENNDEGEEEIYDDIVLGDESPKAKKSPTTAQPQQSAKHKMQYNAEENNDEGEEEFYDDIVLGDESPKAKKSPVLQKKYSITNGDNIKNRAKKLEKFLFKDGYKPKHKTSNQTELDTSTLHKPMQNNSKDTLFSLPKIPTASQNSKSDIFDQPIQPTSNLHKPNKTAEKITTVASSNTPLSSQPPELPPRSYLKR